MNGKWEAGYEPTREELLAWADGELDCRQAQHVEHWLANHPEQAREVDALRQVDGMYRELPPCDPGPLAWKQCLDRIGNRLAVTPVQPCRSSRGHIRWGVRFVLGLTAAAALLSGVGVARSLWPAFPGPIPAVAPAGRSGQDDNEPFPVALASEVEIIRMAAEDADRLALGRPLLGVVEFAALEDIVIEEVDPDPDEGTVLRLEKRAGLPMIVVAQVSEAP